MGISRMMLFLPFFCLISACSGEKKSDDRVLLATVDGESIYLDEATQGMPQGLSSRDSAEYIHQFIRTRARDILLYQQASGELDQSDNIDQLVESYRRSLVIFAYQQKMLAEQMKKGITDADVKAFYDNNHDRFPAGHDLIRGIFIKIPKNATDLGKLRKIYRKSTSDALSQIESFCVQNNGRFEVFYDHWVILDDILDQISHDTGDNDSFLRNHSSLDVVVGDFVYLLYVDDYVLAGTTAPFDYIKDEVRNVLSNTRRTTFITQMEQNMLRQAEKKGDVTYYHVKTKK